MEQDKALLPLVEQYQPKFLDSYTRQEATAQISQLTREHAWSLLEDQYKRKLYALHKQMETDSSITPYQLYELRGRAAEVRDVVELQARLSKSTDNQGE